MGEIQVRYCQIRGTRGSNRSEIVRSGEHGARYRSGIVRLGEHWGVTGRVMSDQRNKEKIQVG